MKKIILAVAFACAIILILPVFGLARSSPATSSKPVDSKATHPFINNPVDGGGMKETQPIQPKESAPVLDNSKEAQSFQTTINGLKLQVQKLLDKFIPRGSEFPLINKINQLKFNGYIIKLEDDSIGVYKLNQEKLGKSVNKNSLQGYINNLLIKQDYLKSQIKSILPSAKFDSSYRNILNGFTVLGISEAEMEKIKNIEGVKSIYPNYEVYPMLMDSVSLINADDVWNLQVNGNNLRGQGVTVGIIDSGIDYTHPDLGQSLIQEREFQYTSNNLDLFGDPSYNLPIPMDGMITLNSNRLTYASRFKIFTRSLNTGITQEIDSQSAWALTRVTEKNDLIAYFGSSPNQEGYSVYLYNLISGIRSIINDSSVVSPYSLNIYNNKIIYSGYNNSSSLNTYVYDLNSNILTVKNKAGLLFKDLIITGNTKPDTGGYCNDSITFYNIISENEFIIYPPSIGPILDVSDDEILYSACWLGGDDVRKFYLYNFSNGSYRTLIIPEEGNSYRGRFQGRIESNLVFLSSRVNGKDIWVYDKLLDRFVRINLLKQANYFDSNEDGVCFYANDARVYCHQYDSSYGYPLPSTVFNSKIIGGWNFNSFNMDIRDELGHGTHVASTLGGNGVLNGIAPDVKIYALKTFPPDSNLVIKAIDYSVDPNQDGDFSDHLDIISISLGGYGDSNDPMSQAVDNAVDLGVVVVIAAGNSGPSGNFFCKHPEDLTGASYSICSPGTARKAITVAASSKNDVIAGFSSRGPTINGVQKPDITAPGISICAAKWDYAWESYKCVDQSHVAISGTSMAAPIVAGVAALLKQANSILMPEQIKQALKNGAKDISYDAYTQGAGRVDALKAINSLLYIANFLPIHDGQVTSFGVDSVGPTMKVGYSAETSQAFLKFNTPINSSSVISAKLRLYKDSSAQSHDFYSMPDYGTLGPEDTNENNKIFIKRVSTNSNYIELDVKNFISSTTTAFNIRHSLQPPGSNVLYYTSEYSDASKRPVLEIQSYGRPYLCGDADGSGAVDISDAVYLIQYIFTGGSAPNPLLAGDADGSGAVDVSDAVYLAQYIFAGGPAPCQPRAEYKKIGDGWNYNQTMDYLKNLQNKSIKPKIQGTSASLIDSLRINLWKIIESVDEFFR